MSDVTYRVIAERLGPVEIDDGPVAIRNVVELAQQTREVLLSRDSSFRARIDKGAEFLDRLLREQGVIYGVTTGYGDSCTVSVPPELVEELPRQLYTFHGCGLGDVFSAEETRAIVTTRLVSLAKGWSGVRVALLEQLECLLTFDILPVIPKEGSVGASGDLTPLSYLAAVLAGERQVHYRGEIRSTAEVFRELDIAPLTLRPKEALAIMNGTAAMTGLACLAIERTDYLARLATRITALTSVALKGNAYHYDPLLFSVKPHPGQNQAAQWIHEDLGVGEAPCQSARLQDRYSTRCAPHVIGVLLDSLDWMREFVTRELNSANDNPIIDGEGEHVLHGGHFYGGHIAFAMDGLKTAVANIADLLDRQLAQLVDTKFNNGLPSNLSGMQGERAAISHGFKAVQIGASAWTAEALKTTMPASVFSRSTECHNQDKVSMGTISARDALRALELTEQVAAAAALGSYQAVRLRIRDGGLEAPLAPALTATMTQIGDQFEMLIADRPLEADLRGFIERIRRKELDLYGN
jgi:histidine ammonia-lyase